MAAPDTPGTAPRKKSTTDRIESQPPGAFIPSAWARTIRKARTLRVAIAIAAFAPKDANGYAYPSLETIVACCGLRKDHVIEAIDWLVANGILSKRKRRSDSNEYLVLGVPASTQIGEGSASGAVPKSGKRSTRNGVEAVPDLDATNTSLNTLNTNERPSSSSKDQEDGTDPLVEALIREADLRGKQKKDARRQPDLAGIILKELRKGNIYGNKGAVIGALLAKGERPFAVDGPNYPDRTYDGLWEELCNRLPESQARMARRAVRISRDADGVLVVDFGDASPGWLDTQPEFSEALSSVFGPETALRVTVGGGIPYL